MSADYDSDHKNDNVENDFAENKPKQVTQPFWKVFFRWLDVFLS